MERKNNTVVLLGGLTENFEYSHSINNENFYTAAMRIQRLSGINDEIPLLVSDRLIDVYRDWRSEFMYIHGEYRSRNCDGHLQLYVFVQDIEPVIDIDYENEINLDGYICKEPVYRKTPSGREIADVLLAVNRSYHRSDYIPCIVWGRNARYVGNMEIGTRLRVLGRIQSREYYKQISEDYAERRIAYEVSVSQMGVVEYEECKDQVTDAE